MLPDQQENPLKFKGCRSRTGSVQLNFLCRFCAADTLNRYGVEMDLDKLKEKLLRIEKKRIVLKDKFNKDIIMLKDTEGNLIESYLKSNAKFQPYEKVFKKMKNSNEWEPCFVARRVINKKTWKIEYYTHNIKKDGTPSKIMSAHPSAEEMIKSHS